MKRKALKILVGIAVSVTAIGLLGWRAMQPKLRGATIAELRAVMPAEVLDEPPRDQAAEDRYDKLGRLLSRFDQDPKLYSPFNGPPNGSREQNEASRRVWAEFWPLHRTVTSLLDAGRLRMPKGEFTNINDFVTPIRVLGRSAFCLALAGEHAKATDLLVDDYRIIKATINARDGLVGLVTGFFDEAAFSESLPAYVPRLTGPECATLLRAIEPTRGVDEPLIAGLQSEAVLYKLPDLTVPAKMWQEMVDMRLGKPGGIDRRDGPIVGTYDAIETARAYGQLKAEEIANARKPKVNSSHTVRDRIRADGAALPVDSTKSTDGDFNKAWNEFACRFAMNNGRNTIGRAVLMDVFDDNVESLSCQRRADLEKVRIQLADAAYRGSHGGSSPATADALVSLLGSWPNDPDSGKPMPNHPVK